MLYSFFLKLIIKRINIWAKFYTAKDFFENSLTFFVCFAKLG